MKNILLAGFSQIMSFYIIRVLVLRYSKSPRTKKSNFSIQTAKSFENDLQHSSKLLKIVSNAQFRFLCFKWQISARSSPLTIIR